MKKLVQGLLTIAVSALAGNAGYAAIYTTAASGNFTAAATWVGGNVPSPHSTAGGDTIIIATGHDVVMNTDVTYGGFNTLVDVSGTLRTTAAHYLEVSFNAEIIVSGTMDVDSFFLRTLNDMTVNGQVTVQKMTVLNNNMNGTGTIVIGQVLEAVGDFTTATTQTITFNDMATIKIGGGFFSLNGNVNFPPNAYDVIYGLYGPAIDARQELTGASLRNVIIDVATPQPDAQVSLRQDLNIANGKLEIKRGILNLNGKNLSVSGAGDIATWTAGAITNTVASDITIANAAGLSTPLRFLPGTALRTLTINPADGTIVKLATDLRLTQELKLQNAKLELLDASKLRLITGATISNASAGRYIITSGTSHVASDIGANNTFAYHIGTQTGYAPVVVTSKNGTVYNGLSARVMSGVKTMGDYGKDIANSQPVVNGTWQLAHNGSSADVSVEVSWPQSWEMGLFDRNSSYLTNFMVHYWDKTLGSGAQPGPDANMYAQKRDFNALGYFAIFDNNTVGVNNIASEVSAKVYPNPVADVLNISMSLKQTEELTITLRDVTGKVLHQVPQQQYGAGSNTVQVSMQGFAPGVYMYTISGADGTTRSTGRVVKQ